MGLEGGQGCVQRADGWGQEAKGTAMPEQMAVCTAVQRERR